MTAPVKRRQKAEGEIPLFSNLFDASMGNMFLILVAAGAVLYILRSSRNT